MSLESIKQQIIREFDEMGVRNPQGAVEFATAIQQLCEHKKQVLVSLHNSPKVEVIIEEPAQEEVTSEEENHDTEL